MARVEDLDDLTLLRERSERAYKELHRRYADGIIKLCRDILASRDLAEDVTEETFEKLWAQPPSFAPRPLKAWLHKVARNKAIDLRRRLLREAARKARLSKEGSAEAPAEAAFENAESVRVMLGELNESQRLLFDLHILQEKDWPEIARIIGGKPAAIKRRFERMCKRLRDAHPDDGP